MRLKRASEGTAEEILQRFFFFSSSSYSGYSGGNADRELILEEVGHSHQ